MAAKNSRELRSSPCFIMISRSLKTLAFAVALLFVSTAVRAADDSEFRQLITAVHDATDLTKAGPYELRATVVRVGPDGHQVNGELIIVRDGMRRRSVLRLAEYQETRVADENHEYISRASDIM